jgi:hypothetical protein
LLTPGVAEVTAPVQHSQIGSKVCRIRTKKVNKDRSSHLKDTHKRGSNSLLAAPLKHISASMALITKDSSPDVLQHAYDSLAYGGKATHHYQGTKRTKECNLRRKKSRRLAGFKEQGVLSSDATFSNLHKCGATRNSRLINRPVDEKSTVS